MDMNEGIIIPDGFSLREEEEDGMFMLYYDKDNACLGARALVTQEWVDKMV